MQRIIIALIIGLLLAGCPLTKDADNGGTGAVEGGDGNAGNGGGAGSGGEVVVVQGNNTGMSDPSRCNNLPPQQMADCLEQSMGG